MSLFRMAIVWLERYNAATEYIAYLLAGASVALMLWCAAALLSGMAWLALWIMTLAIAGG